MCVQSRAEWFICSKLPPWCLGLFACSSAKMSALLLWFLSLCDFVTESRCSVRACAVWQQNQTPNFQSGHVRDVIFEGKSLDYIWHHTIKKIKAIFIHRDYMSKFLLLKKSVATLGLTASSLWGTIGCYFLADALVYLEIPVSKFGMND